MFFKKNETCCICNRNEGSKKILDGMICKDCLSDCFPFLTKLNIKNADSNKVHKAISASNKNKEYLNIFNATTKYLKCIEIDENNRLVRFPNSNPNLIFSYNEIIDFELIQNGETISGGGLGSAVVGGALFGGVGAIVGSNIGKKKTQQEISQYYINVVTSSPFFPSTGVAFFMGKVKSDSFVFKQATYSAQQVLSLLTRIKATSHNNTPASNPISIPDEILKYKELMDNGIITPEEFEAKKKQLLNL
jgi:hypothetical protein